MYLHSVILPCFTDIVCMFFSYNVVNVVNWRYEIKLVTWYT